MPTIWIAVFLSACTFGGGYAVLEMSGVFAYLAKGIYAVTILGLAAYLVTHDGESADNFAASSGPVRVPALDTGSNA